MRVISRQQWTPELAEDVASAEAVVFIDCSLASAAGSIRLDEVAASSGESALAPHTVSPPELLALARDLYGSMPSRALLLTVGAGSTELGEEFSAPVKDALVSACQMLGRAVVRLLD